MNASGVVNFGRRFDVPGKKPFMMDLRQWHGVNIGILADCTGVEPSIIYCMLLVRPVKCPDALLVLKGFSELVGVDYGLEDVDMVLSKE